MSRNRHKFWVVAMALAVWAHACSETQSERGASSQPDGSEGGIPGADEPLPDSEESTPGEDSLSAAPWHTQGPSEADAPDEVRPTIAIASGDNSDIQCSELDPAMQFIACTGACNWVIATAHQLQSAADDVAFAAPSGFVVMDTRVATLVVHEILTQNQPFQDGSLVRHGIPAETSFDVEELPQGFQDVYSGVLDGPPSYEHTLWNVKYELPDEVTLKTGRPLLLGLSTNASRNLIETGRPVVTAVFDSNEEGHFDLSRLADSEMELGDQKIPSGWVTAAELANLWPSVVAALPIKCSPQVAEPPRESDP